MSENENNPLHGLIRQTLHNYRPDYDPQGWELLRRKLRRRRRKLVFMFLFLGIGLGLGGLFLATNYFSNPPKIAATPAPSSLVDRYFSPKKTKSNRLKKVKKPQVSQAQKFAFVTLTIPAEVVDTRLFFTEVQSLSRSEERRVGKEC